MSSCIRTVSSQRPCLKPEPLMVPECLKSGSGVQSHRGRIVVAITDHGNELTKPKGGTVDDQLPQQCLAETLSLGFGCDIDQVLNRPPIGWPGPEITCIGIADHRPIKFPNDIRKSAGRDRVKPPGHLLLVRWVDFVSRCSVEDGIAIDFGDGAKIGRLRRTNMNLGHGVSQAEDNLANVMHVFAANLKRCRIENAITMAGQFADQKKRAAFPLPDSQFTSQSNYSRLPRNCSRNMNMLMKSR